MKNKKIYKKNTITLADMETTPSRLHIVRQSLETNPEIVIAQVFNLYEPPNYGYVMHVADFWVAPKKGLFRRDDLNTLLDGLIPKELGKNFCAHGFNYENTTVPPGEIRDLYFGSLEFREEIGEQKVITIRSISDQQLWQHVRIPKGYKINEETIPYQRLIFVHLFPCEAIVKDILEKKLASKEKITAEELRRYMGSR
jgi:hypothetical protein